jgi:hypothetical protein
MQGEVTKLVQVLRKGYAEQISWDEARIRTGRKLQDQPTGATTSDYECYMEVYWPNCSISKLNAMVASLNEREYINPTIENEARTGTWRNLGVTTTKADDGSGIITMSLAISHFRLDAYITWLTHRTENLVYLFGWGKDEAQAVIDAWKSKGRGATVSYRKEDGLVDLILRERDYDQLDILGVTSSWDGRYKTLIDYHFGVSNPELYPLNTTPVAGVSYDRQLRDNGDGSWDILIITKYVQYTDVPFYPSSVNAEELVETRQQLGLTTETQEPMALLSGIAKTQEVRVNEDSSKNILTNQETGVDQTVRVTSIVSPSAITTVTEKSYQASQLAVPAAVRGYIKRVISKISKYFNMYDTIQEITQPTDQTATVINSTFARTVTKVSHTENAVDLAAPALVLGTIKQQEAVRTEAGNQRTVEIAEVPSDQTPLFGSSDSFSTSAGETHTEIPILEADLATPDYTRIVAMPAEIRALGALAKTVFLNNLTDGEAGSLEIVPGESGNVKATGKIDTAIDVGPTVSTIADHFSIRKITEQTAAASALAEIDATAVNNPAYAGKIGSNNNEPTRFKNKIKTTAVEETAIAQSIPATVIEQSDNATVTMERKYNADTLPAAGVVAGSTIKIEGGNLNRFKKYDYAKITETAHAPTSAGGGYSWTTVGETYWTPYEYNSDGTIYSLMQFQRTYTHAVTFHANAAAAAGIISGGYEGSHVSQIAPYVWQAHRVTQSVVQCGFLVTTTNAPY